MQIAAPHFQEERLFKIAHAYEQSQDWWQKTPKL
jgi:Asp-tRNA(Asn)/Glu-tRNA(Gln) amidotransferase A subunit family amidase